MPPASCNTASTNGPVCLVPLQGHGRHLPPSIQGLCSGRGCLQRHVFLQQCERGTCLRQQRSAAAAVAGAVGVQRCGGLGLWSCADRFQQAPLQEVWCRSPAGCVRQLFKLVRCIAPVARRQHALLQKGVLQSLGWCCACLLAGDVKHICFSGIASCQWIGVGQDGSCRCTERLLFTAPPCLLVWPVLHLLSDVGGQCSSCGWANLRASPK